MYRKIDCLALGDALQAEACECIGVSWASRMHGAAKLYSCQSAVWRSDHSPDDV